MEMRKRKKKEKRNRVRRWNGAEVKEGVQRKHALDAGVHLDIGAH